MRTRIQWAIWITGAILWIGGTFAIGQNNENNWIQWFSAPDIFIPLGFVVAHFSLFRKIHEIHDHITRRHKMNIETYFSPDDDTQTKFIEFVDSAKTRIRLAVYGLHLPPLIEALKAAKARGVDVQLVIDHTQARGTYERPEVLELRAAGIPLAEGTSQKHRIMHHKFVVVDGTRTLSGSWNFSTSASDESNYFDIIEDETRAARFEGIWQEMYTWIEAHEQQYQN